MTLQNSSRRGERLRDTRLRERLLPTTLRLENASRRRRIPLQLRSRPDRARGQVAAAVRAAPTQLVLNAIATEGALECADHRIRSIGRQILVAALAIGAQFKH